MPTTNNVENRLWGLQPGKLLILLSPTGLYDLWLEGSMLSVVWAWGSMDSIGNGAARAEFELYSSPAPCASATRDCEPNAVDPKLFKTSSPYRSGANVDSPSDAKRRSLYKIYIRVQLE